MICLTGATGHLGQTLLRQLASRGEQVSVIVRPGSDRNLLQGLCESIHLAPLDQPDALTIAFKGVSTVIHAAALIDIRRGRRDQLDQVNIEGTKNVLDAARRAGVKRLVYISSIEAIDLHAHRRPVREDFGFARENAVMPYGDSKAEASRIVTAAGLTDGIETVVVCPTSIIGPWDFHGGLLTTMLRRILGGGIPVLVPGGFDFVDVRDVAGAVLAAIGRGRSGESYLASGEFRSVKNLVAMVETAAGVRRHRPILPLWLASAAGEASELWSRATGMDVPFTRGSIDILQIDARVDSAKAAEELGYRPRPLEETVRDTVEWLLRGSAVNPDSLFA